MRAAAFAKPADMIADEAIRDMLLRSAARRAEGATFCPSEVARALHKDWRPLMPEVRRVAAALCDEGRLRCTQKGAPAHPLTARGAIRFAEVRSTEDYF